MQWMCNGCANVSNYDFRTFEYTHAVEKTVASVAEPRQIDPLEKNGKDLKP